MTINFTGACRLFTGIITRDIAESGKVGTAPYIKLTHPYPILRDDFCKILQAPVKLTVNALADSCQLPVLYRKIYGIFNSVDIY